LNSPDGGEAAESYPDRSLSNFQPWRMEPASRPASCTRHALCWLRGVRLSQPQPV